MKTISYVITANDEYMELERLLDQIMTFVRPEDEIMLQLDTTSTEEVKKVAEKYNIFSKCEYHRIYFPLNNDFASFKNNLKNHCTRDYIFFLDADEYLSEDFNQLPEILELNPTVDQYNLPRVNTVEGLTQEWIEKWGWNVNKSGWINYPDYQTRIIKNSKEINWKGKVHERLVGAKTIVEFSGNVYNLFHPKTIEKQIRQNEFYTKL